MHVHRQRHGGIAVMLSIIATLTVAVSGAAAHSLTVDPAGGEAGFTQPVSKGWAQAHCHARSPAVVDDASGEVVTFTPGQALPCPDTVTNPGGQVTGP